MTDEGPFGRIEVRAETWIKNKARCRIFAGLTLLLAAIFPVMCVYYLAAGELELPGALLGGGFALAFAAPFAVVGIRCLRAGLWVSENETIVRGPLGSSGQFRTLDVVGFKPLEANGHLCVALETKTLDHELPILALGREAFIWDFDRTLGQLEPLCDRLNKLLEELRS